MVVGLMHITTKIVSSNPAHGKVNSIYLFVIKFVSDLRQVGGFLRVLRFGKDLHYKFLHIVTNFYYRCEYIVYKYYFTYQ
jgi:hypothetical protein